VCGNFTPKKVCRGTLYEIYQNIFLLLKMDDDDDDIIIAATCLFSPKISAILAHARGICPRGDIA